MSAAAPALSRADLTRIAALRMALSGAVLLLGFRSISDDDFSRVVIAEQLVVSPKLDPSGTSWLPLPFWLNGAAMLVLGRSLIVAHLVAVILGVASSLLVALAAQRIARERRTAIAAGHLATLLGWSAWLGVATVPELFTAALTLFAVSTLVSESPRDRLLGAVSLLCASLSRYEPWPVAALFSVWNVGDVLRRKGGSALASLIALLGPGLWIAWNRAAHGDALHFVARVTAYRRALGETTNDSTLARIAAYPCALLREMPEVVIPAAVGAIFLISPRARAALKARFATCAVPLAMAALQIAALSFALIKDGAPTHHPERAVLFPALVLTVLVASLSQEARPHVPRRTFAAVALVLSARAALMPALARSIGPTRATLWAHLVRQTVPSEAFIDRRSEADIGEKAAQVAEAGTKIYIEAVDDYGFYATLAASGRPEDFVLASDPDPRAPKKSKPLFESEKEYGLWLRSQGIGYVIAPGASEVSVTRWNAAPLRQNGRFDLWAVP